MYIIIFDTRQACIHLFIYLYIYILYIAHVCMYKLILLHSRDMRTHLDIQVLMDIHQHTHPQKFCRVFPPGLASQVNLIALVSTDAWLSTMSAWVAFTELTWGFETHSKISELCVEQEKPDRMWQLWTVSMAFVGLSIENWLENHSLWTYLEWLQRAAIQRDQQGMNVTKINWI